MGEDLMSAQRPPLFPALRKDLGMAQQAADRLSRGLLFAPLVFVAHFLEESPGFVPWFNTHVTRGSSISPTAAG